MTDERDPNDFPNSSFQPQALNPRSENAGAYEHAEHIHRNASEIAGETIAVVGESTGRFPRAPIQEGGAGESTGKSAFLVGAGILISRIIGVIRQRVFAHYFGNSAAADAFQAAFRIPNFLQNVFGEGALSASFIPVYANLLARKDEHEAKRVASAVLTLLALAVSIIVLAGVLGAQYLSSLIAFGFADERRDLVIHLVKVLFPGAGLLVLSAWCLGVLNSHRKFFLSYTAPVVWNLAIIAALIAFGKHPGNLDEVQLGRFQFHLAETGQISVSSGRDGGLGICRWERASVRSSTSYCHLAGQGTASSL